MESWWQLGEGSGHRGQELAVQQITCPFCMERGNFKCVFHAEKKKSNSEKKLNFDTMECGNCRGYVMVLWSAGEHGGFRRAESLHGYEVLPWPLRLEEFPAHWPDEVGRYWLQAKRNILGENWDAAMVMARAALQLALRDCKAEGDNLKQEIDDLARQGILPRMMQEWSDHVRDLGNDSAHPSCFSNPTCPQDARDVVYFLDFLLEYLYTLPHRIKELRREDKK